MTNKVCCFTGHRPEKLIKSESEVKQALYAEIHSAYDAGYRIFITGMSRGVDLWAGEEVLRLGENDSEVCLVCAIPFVDFGNNWTQKWQDLYNSVRERGKCKYIAKDFAYSTYHRRNRWMVDHSDLVIAVYNGGSGGTQKTVEYARWQGKQVVVVN